MGSATEAASASLPDAAYGCAATQSVRQVTELVHVGPAARILLMTPAIKLYTLTVSGVSELHPDAINMQHYNPALKLPSKAGAFDWSLGPWRGGVRRALRRRLCAFRDLRRSQRVRRLRDRMSTGSVLSFGLAIGTGILMPVDIGPARLGSLTLTAGPDWNDLPQSREDHAMAWTRDGDHDGILFEAAVQVAEGVDRKGVIASARI